VKDDNKPIHSSKTKI